MSPRRDELVVCSHLPGEGHFRSSRFRVTGVVCRDDLDYWRGINEHWEHAGPLILVEHDIEVTDAHVQALLDCPQDLCSWAYECHWASTGQPESVIAAGLGARDPDANPDPVYLRGGEEFAAWSAIGLVKINLAARVGLLRQEPWARLELAVHDAVKRPWHMHGNTVGGGDLVAHHHW